MSTSSTNSLTFLKNFPPDFIRSSELDFVLFQIERLYSFSINLAPIAFPIFPVPQSPIFFIFIPFIKFFLCLEIEIIITNLIM